MSNGTVLLRSFAARLGITLLNIWPGMGLLRLDDSRGFSWLSGSVVLNLAFYFGAARLPVPTFAGFATVLGIALLLQLALFIGSIVTTWRRSATVAVRLHWWSPIVACLALAAAEPDMKQSYRGFYIPAEAMLPTLLVDDRILADMRDRRAGRGDIVLLKQPDGIYIKRVVAVAGDTVAIRGGLPVINGRPVRQVPDGTLAVNVNGLKLAQVFRETLPGEHGSHRVLDVGTTPQDNTERQIVPPGHVFVLGDNRDNSEDSRFPVEVGGVGMLAVAAIRGRPLFFYWSHDRKKIGKVPEGGGR